MFEDIEIKTKRYAIGMHLKVNQRYNDFHPYSFHLEMVVDCAQQFIHLIPENDRGDVIAGCWAHDLIEDAGVSYNDVKNATNEIVAEYSYALTNEKGRNRKERANGFYYQGIRVYKHATFIKLCDRMANILYGKDQGSRQFEMYKKEYPHFKSELYDGRFIEMWSYLDNLLK